MLSILQSTLPEEIHISQIGKWLSSHKGSEPSSLKAFEESETIRKSIISALECSVMDLQEKGVKIPVDIEEFLSGHSFKSRDLFSFCDYQKFLTELSSACGPSGEKNMFGVYNNKNLEALRKSIEAWEEKHLHINAQCENLVKLVKLVYPHEKHQIDEMLKRAEESSRQLSFYEQLVNSYEKKCKSTCAEWGLAVDLSFESNDSESTLESMNLKGNVDVSVNQQLHLIASSSFKQDFFGNVRSKLRAEPFVKSFLFYRSYLSLLGRNVPECSLNNLPCVEMALRLFAHSLVISSYFFHRTTKLWNDNHHLFDEEKIKDKKDLDYSSCDEFVLCMGKVENRDKLVHELTMIYSFFLSMVEDFKCERHHKYKIDGSIGFSSSEDAEGWSFSQMRLDIVSLEESLHVTKDILGEFESPKYFKMISLDEVPALLTEVQQDIMTSYNKTRLFTAISKRISKERDDMIKDISMRRQAINLLRQNILLTKQSLEMLLSGFNSSLIGNSECGVKVVDSDFDNILCHTEFKD